MTRFGFHVSDCAQDDQDDDGRALATDKKQKDSQRD